MTLLFFVFFAFFVVETVSHAAAAPAPLARGWHAPFRRMALS